MISHAISRGESLFLFIICYNITEGEPTYPYTVTVSSTEGAAEEQVSSMGVYKKTYQIHSGRPVWKSTVKDDRFLFYNGKNIKY